MPEQIGLGVALPARLETGDDLSKLRMQRRLGKFPRLDMGAQAAEFAALFFVRRVVKTDLQRSR
jgi:hypothetical protein